MRSDAELQRARDAATQAGLSFQALDEQTQSASGHISISTLHQAQGLEFYAIAVMACDDEVIPSQARIETVADEADLKEAYNTERHLLYVACPCACEQLFVSRVKPISEFLDDLRG